MMRDPFLEPDTGPPNVAQWAATIVLVVMIAIVIVRSLVLQCQ